MEHATCAIRVLAANLAVMLAARAAEPICPLIPMGAITGQPDDTAVRETLEAYKSVGVEQYLIYPAAALRPSI
jgi:hypothetical protein